jgi:hypothetical protein
MLSPDRSQIGTAVRIHLRSAIESFSVYDSARDGRNTRLRGRFRIYLFRLGEPSSRAQYGNASSGAFLESRQRSQVSMAFFDPCERNNSAESEGHELVRGRPRVVEAHCVAAGAGLRSSQVLNMSRHRSSWTIFRSGLAIVVMVAFAMMAHGCADQSQGVGSVEDYMAEGQNYAYSYSPCDPYMIGYDPYWAVVRGAGLPLFARRWRQRL